MYTHAYFLCTLRKTFDVCRQQKSRLRILLCSEEDASFLIIVGLCCSFAAEVETVWVRYFACVWTPVAR